MRYTKKFNKRNKPCLKKNYRKHRKTDEKCKKYVKKIIHLEWMPFIFNFRVNIIQREYSDRNAEDQYR